MGGGERAGTVSTAQLQAQSAEIQSSAQNLRAGKQTNAVASATAHRQTSVSWNLVMKHKLQMAKQEILKPEDVGML